MRSVLRYGVVLCLVAAFFLFMLTGSVIMLRWVNPPFTAFTLQHDRSESEIERYNLRTWWVDTDDIPHHLRWAVIASEDQRFREHRGFDIEAIKTAWEERNEGIRQRGASTISQQVAKNLYLWPDHSWVRKGLEASITLLIEIFWSKDRIMEVYLNIAEFGPGLHGIGKSSQELFGVPAGRLEPIESARLAAVLPNPNRMRANPPSPFVEERSHWILNQMTQLSGITFLPEEDVTEPIEDEITPSPDTLETEYNPDPLLPVEAEAGSRNSESDTLQLSQTETDSLALPDTTYSD